MVFEVNFPSIIAETFYNSLPQACHATLMSGLNIKQITMFSLLGWSLQPSKREVFTLQIGAHYERGALSLENICSSMLL